MKRFSGFTQLGIALAVLLALVWGTGCDKNATQPPQNQLQLSKAATEGLVSSWQMVHSVNTVDKVDEMVSDDIPIDKSVPGGTYSLPALNKKITQLMNARKELTSASGFHKITDDSLLWFREKTDPITGVTTRQALYYNDSTGYGRYYEVKFNFPANVQLQYDSTEIRVDLNFTPLNITDDRFISLYKFSEFKPGYHIVKVEEQATATDWGPGNKITGAILQHNVWYAQDSDPKQLTQELEINPDHSGHISERLDYWDGSFYQKLINFYSDYTGDFTENWRDGTLVTGTFDRLIDDNHGQFAQTIQFPAGHDPQTMEQFADITLSPADSSVDMIFKEKIHYASGEVDTSRMDVSIFREGETQKIHIQAWKSNGEHADLMVSKNDSYEEIDGNYTGPEGYYATLYSIRYSDGSGELWVKIWESENAYQNGEPPLVVIHIIYNPDGTGRGTLSEGGKEYNVRVAQDGKIQVTDSAGNVTQLNGF